jgi:hypothetical protein
MLASHKTVTFHIVLSTDHERSTAAAAAYQVKIYDGDVTLMTMHMLGISDDGTQMM